ncbi:MAG: glutamine-hydrolyzing carbamoyl-phosphate synthase small subunit [Clostridia bacterium]|nr:glutamine-hydrolyzing carbamoyl-phosphate synthase small subunit [Clostridia bacterium]
MEKIYLVLANGKVFEGESAGAPAECVGELVFTTGMAGYLETLTDPSYAGQIVTQTFPMIGNYGVIPEDFEGKSAVSGYVVRELCEDPSNFRSQGAIKEFLKENGIPCVCGVDTRELTRIIREEGAMPAAICRKVPSDLSAIKAFEVKNVVSRVSQKEKSVYNAENEKYKVALIDYGAKRNIVRCLVKRGCTVTVYPNTTPAEEILSAAPDGVMLSNGPGDPAENLFEIEQIKKIIGKKPVFGICLGHQLTALALGGKTVKLKYGHRGANQPVTDGVRTYITSQNHGYAVLSDTLKDIGRELFKNADDNSCEGMEYKDLNCFTVQFHPEACAGPQDTEFLFDRFVGMMGGKTNA